MRLLIDNFTKIKEADLQFDGITVIAGNNNTGKSTVGKILFTLFDVLKDIEQKTFDERKNEIINIIYSHVKERADEPDFSLRRELKILLKDIKNPSVDISELIGSYLSLKAYADDIDKDGLTNKINEIQSIPKAQIENEIIENKFNNAFHSQINSLISDETSANIKLKLKGKNISLNFRENSLKEYVKEINIINNAFYTDNPFLINYCPVYGMMYDDSIYEALLSSLNKREKPNIVESLIGKQKLSMVFEKLQTVLSGSFVNRDRELFFKHKDFKEELNIKNLSAGLKSFAILKKLLENGSLKEKDVIILDEPEIHLHPEWQLVYAELIVLLQKAFTLTVLITTHSPFFLDAIEVFSAKHEISDRLHYYLSVKKDKSVTFEDVTNNIEAIYAKMAEPMQFLESLRNQIRMEG